MVGCTAETFTISVITIKRELTGSRRNRNDLRVVICVSYGMCKSLFAKSETNIVAKKVMHAHSFEHSFTYEQLHVAGQSESIKLILI